MMELTQNLGMEKDVVPSLIRSIDANEVVGFDDDLMKQNVLDFEIMDSGGDKIEPEISNVQLQHRRTPSISISMPPSPTEASLQNTKRVAFRDDVESVGKNEPPTISATKFYSQPIPTGVGFADAGKFPNRPVKNPRIEKLKDERYNSFKTWSGKLERQISTFRGKPSTEPPVLTPRTENLPVDRYFDALEGPELETLRASEEIILPDDKNWPFLLRYPISSFGICLGVSSQAIMWKSLATMPSTQFLHITLKLNLTLWCISVLLFAVVAAVYLLKLTFYFEAVRREYYHPIRVNFFFAPWITLLFLAIGLPPTVATNIPQFLWYVLMTPIFILEVKIYGQWKSGGQRRLSKVANPVNHLSIVGNFVGALLGASIGLKEGPIFFFAVGIAHYTVVRVNFFRGFKFSLAWWAYTFPMTGAAIATIRYSTEVSNIMTKTLLVTLSIIATLTVFGLLVTTILHAFVMRDLFPNDIAIAISDRKPTAAPKWFHRRSGSSENDIEHYLKYVTSNEKDVEVNKDVESQTPLP
ncbi:hypothetical protein E3N88_39891 [Mikania micrantha]|uniref:C4-dicarboxylate transporter/malic acid transport protein n=1 Tax=Mikania micrantha TaxID=192012 RepID=A0A5N6LL49_9ASTR|nr:hypothetical protein E3N88_39891 [Mikania micrantha]